VEFAERVVDNGLQSIMGPIKEILHRSVNCNFCLTTKMGHNQAKLGLGQEPLPSPAASSHLESGLVPQVASALEPDPHDVSDLRANPGQLGEEQQGEEQTLDEDHALETRFDPLSSQLEFTEISDRRTIPPHQVEGGNEGVAMVGGYPTPPSSDDGSLNQGAEHSGKATISCRPISGQEGPWKKEVVVSSQPRVLTEGEVPLHKTPFWA
jgi:hypothetical protein